MPAHMVLVILDRVQSLSAKRTWESCSEIDGLRADFYKGIYLDWRSYLWMALDHMALTFRNGGKCRIAGKGTLVNIPVVLLHVIYPLVSSGKLSFGGNAIFRKTDVRPEISINMLPLSTELAWTSHSCHVDLLP